MKVLTKEEEDAHYHAVLTGGIGGGVVGTAVGLGGVYLLHRRFPFFRSLTLPLKAFLVTSTGTFFSIISADRYSRNFQSSAHHPGEGYIDATAAARRQALARESTSQRIMTFGRENRYKIVTASWVASMGISLGLVWRDPYLTRAQKLVQARVYAQGLTLLVLIASAAFEVSDSRNGKNEDVYEVPDPTDPTHKRMIEKKVHHEHYKGEDLWMDMVASEEQKMAERKKQQEEQQQKRKEGGGKKDDGK